VTQHVLITGAATGFGESLVYSYSAAGWKVTATMRDTSKAPAEFGQLDNVLVTRLDITDETSIREGLAAATAQHGPVDVLANVAGRTIGGSLEETSLDQIRDVFETNVIGTLAITKAVLPSMRERRAGHVLAFSSAGGVVAMPTFPTYGSSKFAVEGFFEGLSFDLAHLGVKVTIIEPGVFATELGAKGVQPENPIDEYAPARELLPGMFDFTAGSLEVASDAIVKISGTSDAPLRLYVGHGLDSVRRRYQDHLDQYAATEYITNTTL